MFIPTRAHLRPGNRQYTAGMGLRYRIPHTKVVRDFFNDIESAWGERLAEYEAPVRRLSSQYKPRFTLYNTPKGDEIQPVLGDVGPEGVWEPYLGWLTVAELRVSGGNARRHRLSWAARDAGRVRNRLANDISALRSEYGFSHRPLDLTLSQVAPVGQRTGRHAERKFALIPGPEDPAALFLVHAHAMVMRVLGEEQRGRRHRDDADHADRLVNTAYVPHVTVGYIHREVPFDAVRDCAGLLMDQVVEAPLVVTLAHEEIYDYHSLRQNG